MNHTDEMLNALEALYTTDKQHPLRYTQIQRAHILRQLGALPQSYTIELYNEASKSLGTQYRTLPDMSVFEACMKQMGRPETFEPPQRLEQLPYNPQIDEQIQEEADKRKKAGEPIWKPHRDQVRERCRMHNATKFDSWWLYWLDTHSPAGERTTLGPMPAAWDADCYDGYRLSGAGRKALGVPASDAWETSNDVERLAI